MNQSHTPRPDAGRPGTRGPRGTAMTEMVLAIPFIAIILSLLMFLGQGVVRLKSSYVIDRFEAWRQVAIAPAPAAADAPVPSRQRENANDGTPGNDGQLNKLFFNGRAAQVESNSDRYFPVTAMSGLVDNAYSFSDGAGRLAASQMQTLLEQDNQTNAMLTGRRVRIETSFPNDGTVWSNWEGVYRHSHTRIGNEWRAANGWKIYNDDFAEQGGFMVTMEPAIRDTFYTDFDGRMAAISGPGKRLADSLRTFYNRRYIYCGPDLRYRCWWW